METLTVAELDQILTSIAVRSQAYRDINAIGSVVQTLDSAYAKVLQLWSLADDLANSNSNSNSN